MVTIGRVNHLEVLRKSAADFHLDGGEFGDIPLPKISAPADCQVGLEVSVFVYIDHEGYLAATTDVPRAQVGDVAWLKVVSIDAYAAFLDWGWVENLALPRAEQKSPVKLGQYCMVQILLDKQYGIVASSRLDDFLLDSATEFTQGQKVSLLIGNATELGLKVVINDRYWGLLYEADIFQPLRKGQKVDGYIKKLRSDNKLDVSLTPLGYGKVDSISESILSKLKDHGGFMAISDKSEPETIYAAFGVSKSAFKQAIGSLYKERLIIIEKTGIKLV